MRLWLGGLVGTGWGEAGGVAWVPGVRARVWAGDGDGDRARVRSGGQCRRGGVGERVRCGGVGRRRGGRRAGCCGVGAACASGGGGRGGGSLRLGREAWGAECGAAGGSGQMAPHDLYRGVQSLKEGGGAEEVSAGFRGGKIPEAEVGQQSRVGGGKGWLEAGAVGDRAGSRADGVWCSGLGCRRGRRAGVWDEGLGVALARWGWPRPQCVGPCCGPGPAVSSGGTLGGGVLRVGRRSPRRGDSTGPLHPRYSRGSGEGLGQWGQVGGS